MPPVLNFFKKIFAKNDNFHCDAVKKKCGRYFVSQWVNYEILLVVAVAALKMNEILKELFIGDNKLMPTDGVQVGNLLKYNHRLELLDLRNNHLQVLHSYT